MSSEKRSIRIHHAEIQNLGHDFHILLAVS